MKLHFFQQVPFEDLAGIFKWAEEKGHKTSGTLFFEDYELPEIDDFDWLIVLGGYMNVYENEKFPWLVEEKEFIKKAISESKIVLGICLGAQLIADVLGGKIYKNEFNEIGWYPVSLTEDAQQSAVFNSLPDEFVPFHWHGDTFTLPPGCRRTVESKACENQAFEYNGKVIGLQFHLESTEENIYRLITNCADEIVRGEFIQNPDEMLRQDSRLEKLNKLMTTFLDCIESQFGSDFN